LEASRGGWGREPEVEGKGGSQAYGARERAGEAGLEEEERRRKKEDGRRKKEIGKKKRRKRERKRGERVRKIGET
jgi:hypothetical protein